MSRRLALALLCLLAAVSALSAQAPPSVQFLDPWGRVTSSHVPGDPVTLRVANPARNDDAFSRESFAVQVTVASGDVELIEVTETGVDSGVFLGEMGSRLLYLGSGGPAPDLLTGALPDAMTAELPHAEDPGTTTATATWVASRTEIVDEMGAPAGEVLESSRLRLVVFDPNTSPAQIDTLQVEVTAALSGDVELVTVTETGPATGLFRGSVRLELGGAQSGDGVLQTTEDPGPPHRFDEVAAVFTSPAGASSDTVPLLGSRTLFVAAAGLAGGLAGEAESYAAGSTVFVRVEDHNANQQPGQYDTSYALVRSGAGDQESVDLLETGRDTGVFVGTRPLGRGAVQSIDGVLQAEPGDTVTVEHSDALGNSQSSDTAPVTDLSLLFVDADGFPTAVLLEDGTARIRLFGEDENGDPFTVDSTQVPVTSLRTGDTEVLELTETGPDTSLFEATFRLDSGSPASSGDGRLQTATSGYPEYLPDQVTAGRHAVVTTALTAGSAVTFRDEHGRPVTLYAAGETVWVRVEDHNRNQSTSDIESFSLQLRTLAGGETADQESVTVTESGFDTGVFLGSIPAALTAGPGVLQTAPGAVIEAEHFNANTPTPTVARADVGGSVTLFVTASGAPAEVYLESSRAYLRVIDAYADVSESADSTPVEVSSFLAGDQELVTLVETGPHTGVFAGSIRLRLGGAQPGDGVLQTTEDPGPPFKADTLLARHFDGDGNGGSSTAQAGLAGSRTVFVNAFGNPTDSYARETAVYVRVEDHNSNRQSSAYDQASVTLTATGGDHESIALLETGRDTGVFTGTLPLGRGPVQSIDQVLQAEDGETLTAEHDDDLGNSSSTDIATVAGLAIAWIDDAGRPTAVLLEDGVARIRVWSAGDNEEPFTADQLGVEVRSLHTGDVEVVTLTETGLDTGVFEGTVELDSGSGTSSDGRLLTATSGFPEYRPDRVTASRGPVSATALTAGSRVTFLDGFGRPTGGYAAGETLHVEVADHNRNSSSAERELFAVYVRALTLGGEVSLQVEETGFDTGLFRGSLPTTTQGGGSSTVLRVADADVVEVRHFNNNSPIPTTAQAEIGAAAVLFVTEDDQPAAVYLESTRAFLRVHDAYAAGSVQVELSSALAGDQEVLTLTETAAGSHVFTGSIALDLGGAQPGDGRLQTTEDAGPPFEFDRLRAAYVSPHWNGSPVTAEVGMTGSRTMFVAAAGLAPGAAEPVEGYAAGSAVFVRVEDHNANRQPGAYNSAYLRLSSSSGDQEFIELLETGRDTGVFTGTLPLGRGAVQSIDQVLQAEPGDTLTAHHDDELGNSFSSDTAVVLSLSLAFIDEAGAVTTVLLEDGTARIRAFSAGDDTDPGSAEQIGVEVASLHTGDVEFPILTETGPNTGTFEGSIRLESGGGGGGAAGGDGRLQTLTSGFPEYRPDRVTARRGPVSAVATTAGSRVTFLDEFGREVPRYAVGETVRVRVEDHNRNTSSGSRETFTIYLRSLDAGDEESVEVEEVNFDTGVFVGILPTVPPGGPTAQALVVAAGDTIEARHFNNNSPLPTVAGVEVAGSVTLFVTADGAPAEVYLESSRAYLRVIDGGASGSIEVQVSSFLAGDLELVALGETAVGSRVFEGSIRLGLGGAVSGDGVLQTTEDPGLPFEFDQIVARHLDADGLGGESSATAGLVGSRTMFVAAAGLAPGASEPVEGYAAGSAVFVRVEDHNANRQPGVYNSAYLRLTSSSGDVESIELLETGRDTGVFTGTLPLGRAPVVSADGVLQAEPGDTLTARHDDELGNSSSSDTAVVLSLSLGFIDEAGAVTTVLLENGTARIRAFSAGDNTDPGSAEQMAVEVASLHTGDVEFPSLTETGPDSDVFEGTVRLESGGGGAVGGAIGGDHRLQTATSGSPEYRPDRVTVRRGPVSAVATTAGSRVEMLDRYGRPTSRYAVGERLTVRVTDYNRNQSSGSRDTFTVYVRALAGGDEESIQVEETNFDTGVFTGSIAMGLVGPSGSGVLSAAAGDTVEARHFNNNSPHPTLARATILAGAVLFVTAGGEPAEVYLESSRAYLRVVDSAVGGGSVEVQVSAFLSGDLELVTLGETASGSGVFEGSIRLALGGGSAGDGMLQTTEDPGVPFEFDRLRASYGGPSGSVAEIGLLGSRTMFVAAAGLAPGASEPVESYAAGSAVFVRVEDHNANRQPGIYNSAFLRLTSSSGDVESIELLETGRDTGVFTGTLPLGGGAVQSGNLVLQAGPGDTVTARHDDELGNSSSSDTAAVASLSLAFVDEAGAVTLRVLENGTARIRMFSRGDDTDPAAAEQTTVEVHSLHTGDVEFPTLIETGVATGLFEGILRLDGGGAVGGNGLLQITTSGFPEYRPDRVTVRRGPVSATATTAGSRVEFIDAFGREVSSYAAGDRLHVRVTDHNRNQDADDREQFTVYLRSLDTGDEESLTVEETGFDTGVFAGSLFSSLDGFPGTLRVAAGDTVEAEHFNDNSPEPTVARAAVADHAVLFVTATGEPAEVYLESSRAYLRAIDATASGSLTVEVSAFLSGDLESVVLLESGAGSHVFVGSIDLALGGVQSGNGVLETTEDPGPPVELDTLRAAYTTPGGTSTATVGLLGSRTAFVDAAGNEAESYAAGSSVFVRVEDHNVDGPDQDTVLVRLTSSATGDDETLELAEAGDGIFTGSLALVTVAGGTGDGRLQAQAGERLTVRHDDQLGNTFSGDEALVAAFSLGFVEADGSPAAVLVESGVARVRMFSRSDNSDPGQAESLQVELVSLHTGDLEFPVLTETGPDTSVFEAGVELDNTSPYGTSVPDDGRLQTAHGAHPEYRTDRVTARRGPVSATVPMVGSRLWFLDLLDQVTDSYPQRATVRMRLEDHNRGRDPQVWIIGVAVGVPGGDGEPIQLTETGPTTGIFEGELATTDQPTGVFDGPLTALAGDVLEARAGNSTPIADTVVHATVRGGYAPQPADDEAQAIEGQPQAIDVLANDLGTPPLAVAAVEPPQHGTAAIAPDGTVTYTATLGYTGPDSFRYLVADGDGGQARATVQVEVLPSNRPPAAAPDSATTPEDQAVAIPVLGNDVDPDGDALTVAAVTQPAAGGTVAITQGGTAVTFTPAPDFSGTGVTFTYNARDPEGLEATGTVTVDVTPVNDAPDAVDDSATTEEDEPVVVTVLANDVDLDGNSLTVQSVTQPAHGTAVINPDGTITYTPELGYSHATDLDAFSYTVSDGNGGTDTATVSVAVTPVNDAPEAGDDAATTAEDVQVGIEVLANDSDPDGDTLTVASVTQPANGAVVINPDKTLSYTPNANFSGTDTFSYTISDGNGGTDTGAVTVTVSAANDAPEAGDDSASTAEDVQVGIAVLANDSDPDGDTLSVTLLTQPSHGSAVVNPDRTVTYTPASNYNGPDSFSYSVSDGNGGSDSATVSIGVGSGNDAPVALDDSTATVEDAAVVVTVLANDSDLDGDTLTISGLTQPAHGTAVVNPNKTITYTPAANHFGADAFSYTVSDGNGGSDSATVAVAVSPVNDAPVAVDDGLSTVAETAANRNLKSNDSDVDSPTLTITAVTQGANGTVVLQANQTVTYTPAAGFVGSDSFSYTLSDGAGGSDTATVLVTVSAPPRVATNLQVLYTFGEGTGTTVNDVSGVGTPINLTVGTPGAVSWGAGFLAVNSATQIQSAANATKVIAACQASNQITMEAWVDPLNTSQSGPAPLVTVSQSGSKRDFTLGQSGTRYDGRLRTSSTNQAGSSLQSASGSATSSLRHVIYTRDAGGAVRIYVNGVLSASTTLNGNFSSWTAYKLAVANEVGGGQAWRGDLHLVAVYSRALSAAEVRQNFLAGAN